ncbi:hypothetical protein [Streptomyces sp. NPDC048106]|uniref:hypothetical protein n=1 Tax=Streptomyces sp. NPDC048106 TaxID=3155750 RepID=UPI003452D222
MIVESPLTGNRSTHRSGALGEYGCEVPGLGAPAVARRAEVLQDVQQPVCLELDGHMVDSLQGMLDEPANNGIAAVQTDGKFYGTNRARAGFGLTSRGPQARSGACEP